MTWCHKIIHISNTGFPRLMRLTPLGWEDFSARGLTLHAVQSFLYVYVQTFDGRETCPIKNEKKKNLLEPKINRNEELKLCKYLTQSKTVITAIVVPWVNFSEIIHLRKKKYYFDISSGVELDTFCIDIGSMYFNIIYWMKKKKMCLIFEESILRRVLFSDYFFFLL